MRQRTCTLLTCLLAAAPLLAQRWPQNEDDDKQAARDQWFYTQRAYPAARVPAGARLNAIRRLQQIDAAARQQHLAAAAAGTPGRALTMDSANWTLIGPKPSGGGTSYVTAGRVNAIAIDPRNNNVVYIGAAEGGIWKTIDGGSNWTPLTDGQPSLANGAIALDPTNPDTVYVGTGEENFAYDSYYGAGILKSSDAGATWSNIVGPFLLDSIGAIAVHPTNGKILLCSSRAGIWRSADAGNTWTPVLSGAAGISVFFDPTNGGSAYATLGSTGGAAKNGVYHSTDGGVTWTATNGSGGTALPSANVGRIELTMAPSAPATLYAQIQNSSTASFGALLGIYKSTDGGNTWAKLPAQTALWGNQLWYDNTIRVSPTDPNNVWAGALQIYRSLDGGNTWTALPQSGSNNTEIHVDFHSLAFSPDGSELYLANDGGMYSTTNVASQGVNWTELNDTLAITQFYPGLAVDPANPLIVLGGTQDNSTQLYDGAVNWSEMACGDGAYTLIDPAFPQIAYTSCGTLTGASIARTLGLSASSSWISAVYGIDQTDPAPFIGALAMDPSNPQALYYGTYRLYQSQDGGGLWNAVSSDLTGGQKGTSRAIAVAPADSNTVYIGTSNSKVAVTSTVGAGASAAWTDVSAGLPPRTVTQIAVDALDARTAYVTFSGFSGTADQLGHVFRTSNGGANWTDISGNLPNIPVNDIVLDPDIPGAIYLGMDAGVMVTTNSGATWSSLGNGLPRVVVDSLAFDRGSRVLRAGTHGRAVWEILVPLAGASVRPAITSLAPGSVNPGGTAFSLTVTGSNFTSGTVIRWNGQSRSTTFVDASHVSAQITAADIANPGRASVMAQNPVAGGGASNAAAFQIGSGPQATTASVVSAASSSAGVAPRSIVTVYGVNLASQTVKANLAPPLPYTLGGATLTLTAGTSSSVAPLFYVSPTQISFQVPLLNGAATQTLAITQGVQSTAVPLQIVSYAPAIFTTNSQGTGQGSVLIANTATMAAPVGAFANSRPAKIGEYISIFCTGLGDVANRPALGSASPSAPLSTTLAKPTVTVGGVAATVQFSGLAPGYVGLYQVNVQVPATAPTGTQVPVAMTIGGVTSNMVEIAIDPGQ
jgi:uncharacterized protein (TIGR03437 family)